MPKIGQIRGMLLEEALLHLLRGSGYRTVEAVNNDETLKAGAAGLSVKGRGGNHQIDAIADFLVSQPFSHPQRLLVEAKCYSNKVRLPVVRNAVEFSKMLANTGYLNRLTFQQREDTTTNTLYFQLLAIQKIPKGTHSPRTST